MKSSVAIVVHVYKSGISPFERISLTQLNRVLSRYPVFVVAPEGLDVSAYRTLLGEQLRDVVWFDKKFFKDLRGYNKLLMSQEYYKPFLSFTHILLHHPDAFVFRDELTEWADKDLDQIGAPVYEYDGTPNPTRFFFSGNGGLSLRKVDTFFRLSKSMRSVFNWDELAADFRNYSWKGRVVRFPYHFMMLTSLGSRLHPAFNRIAINEDAIWGMLVPKYIPEFKNAGFDEGLKFSMEFNCDVLYRLNGSRLPFGCHGWFKPMFIAFWKPFIEQAGYQLDGLGAKE